ncbi:ribosome biogenesis/translation initiation ATPase RLI [Candidatus Woesearchaeota archaeon]|nr:ribosome biogenesis/translation initiation ATPase RLI [Candidatus Woesearchaeota archaeon]
MPRIAIIHKDKCNPQSCGGYLCIRVCPINMKGEECIAEGSDGKPVIDEILCTGCGICPNRCPFGAIDIINLPEALDKPPVNRYGQNGFHLYNLPIPLFGHVVGIIGRNGIGKSTALKIISGMIKPNLGGDEPASFEQVHEFFKGSSAQNFFEKQHEGKLTVAYKPQQVDLLPQTAKGKVRELLHHVDGSKRAETVARQLDIAHILDNDIAKLSGGELQRLAIAATVLKKADVYIFDEPTSFLDIKQRLRVSRFIRDLASDETSVMVVEHDLVMLDHMTDYLHILYGKQACYGISSLVKSTRNGINTFLSGYIREENMRFRDHAIEFLSKPPASERVTPQLTEWNDVELTLGRFSLSAPSGELRTKEIVGVLGENGIGKTTFVKLLAGLLKPDKGVLDTKIRVSYKPQYLEVSEDEQVATVVAEAMAKHHTTLIVPLQIEPLLEKNLSTLSGGELQRVAICVALAKDADLYLLDEPSAYLDVEQRLIVSKVIRDFRDYTEKTLLVVDHDVVFVDYIADRLMVFTGKPAKQGTVNGPFEMEPGMNLFLKDIGITMRRDEESKRPRINKLDSRKDREQKESGHLYYGV